MVDVGPRSLVYKLFDGWCSFPGLVSRTLWERGRPLLLALYVFNLTSRHVKVWPRRWMRAALPLLAGWEWGKTQWEGLRRAGLARRCIKTLPYKGERKEEEWVQPTPSRLLTKTDGMREEGMREKEGKNLSKVGENWEQGEMDQGEEEQPSFSHRGS